MKYIKLFEEFNESLKLKPNQKIYISKKKYPASPYPIKKNQIFFSTGEVVKEEDPEDSDYYTEYIYVTLADPKRGGTSWIEPSEFNNLFEPFDKDNPAHETFAKKLKKWKVIK